jgi:Tol biopolymer transport system component
VPLAPGTGNAFRSGTGNLYTVRPNSRGLRQLTFRNGSDPAWSPNAGKLIFVRGRQRGRTWSSRLFTMRADGGGLRRVTTAGADYPDHPSWSPDGKLIGYHGFDSGVWVQRMDGRSLRQVATGGVGATYYFDAVEHDWQPLPSR